MKRSCDAIMSRMVQNTHRLEVELESGGNLRYELGSPSIGWSVTIDSPYIAYVALHSGTSK